MRSKLPQGTGGTEQDGDDDDDDDDGGGGGGGGDDRASEPADSIMDSDSEGEEDNEVDGMLG